MRSVCCWPFSHSVKSRTHSDKMEFCFCIFWNKKDRKHTHTQAATSKQLLFVNSFISIILTLWRRFLWITPINETHCKTIRVQNSERARNIVMAWKSIGERPSVSLAIYHWPNKIHQWTNVWVRARYAWERQSIVTVHSSIQFIFRISCYVILSIYISLNFAFVAIGIACVCVCVYWSIWDPYTVHNTYIQNTYGAKVRNCIKY